MRLRAALLGLLLSGVVAAVAWAAAEETSDSFRVISNTPIHKEVQLFNCDVGDTITGTGPAGGETCETGDWTPFVDARNYQTMSLYVFEYGGSMSVTLWDCLSPLVTGGWTPGEDEGGDGGDPAETQTDQTDPMCVDITAGAGVTIIGTSAGVQKFSLSERKFNFLIGRITACTNCVATAVLTLGP